jgi:hypothetical protein
MARGTVGANSDALNNLVTNANSSMTALQSPASNLVDADVAQLAMKEQEKHAPAAGAGATRFEPGPDASPQDTA